MTFILQYSSIYHTTFPPKKEWEISNTSTQKDVETTKEYICCSQRLFYRFICPFDEFLKNDDEKYALLNRLFEQGYYTEGELDSRNLIFRERVSFLQNAMNAEPILQNFFYLVVFGGDKANLEERFFKITGTYEKRLFEDYASQESEDMRPELPAEETETEDVTPTETKEEK